MGALVVVNGVGHPDDVFKRLCDAVESPAADASVNAAGQQRGSTKWRYRLVAFVNVVR